MIRQLAHLCLMSHQLPAMTAFYRDGLGLPIKFSLKHDDGTAFGHYFEAGHMTFIEIFDRAGAVKQWGGEFAKLNFPELIDEYHALLSTSEPKIL